MNNMQKAPAGARIVTRENVELRGHYLHQNSLM